MQSAPYSIELSVPEDMEIEQPLSPLLFVAKQCLGLTAADLAEIAGVSLSHANRWIEADLAPPLSLIAVLSRVAEVVEVFAFRYYEQWKRGRTKFPIFKSNELARQYEERNRLTGHPVWPKIGEADGMFAALSNLAVYQAQDHIADYLHKHDLQAALDGDDEDQLCTRKFDMLFSDETPFEDLCWRAPNHRPQLQLVSTPQEAPNSAPNQHSGYDPI